MISMMPAATTGLRRRSFSVVAALAAAAVVLGAAIVYQPVVVAVVVPGIALLLLVIGVTRALTPSSDARMLQWVMTWTLAAFAIHVVAGLVIVASSDLTRYFGGDAVTYSTGAAGIVQHWTHGAALPSSLPTGKTGFYYMLAALYLGFGVHPQVGIVVNAAMLALVIPLLTDATRRHLGTAAARPVPVLVTLMPGFLIWGSQLLREAGVYFLIAVALNCAVRMMARTSAGAVIVMVLAVGLLFTFRADVGLLVGGGLAVAITLGRRHLAGGLASGLGTLALILALVLGGGLGYSGYRFVTHTSLAQVNNVRSDSSHSAASGYLQSSDVSTPRHAASYIPVGASYFVLGPAPWQIHSLRQVLAVPDALVWWFLLPSFWRGVREGRRRWGREILIYLLPALALTVVLTLLIANFGTSVRERMQVIIFLVPLIGLGWSIRHPARQNEPVAVTADG
jgi:hypothetical protein